MAAKRIGRGGRPFLGDEKKSVLLAIRVTPELRDEIERRRGDLPFGTFHRECLILGLKHSRLTTKRPAVR